MLETAAEEALVRPHRLVEIGNRDPEVVDSTRFHAGDATGSVHFLRMGRRLATGALAIATLTLLAAACGGSGSSSNGEAGKAPTMIYADAKRAALSAKTVHVAGTITDSGNLLNLDLVIANGSGKGTMSEGGLSFEIIRIGETAYLKASDAFLRRFAGAAAATRFHDTWLKGSVKSGVLASITPLTDLTKLFNGAFGTHGKLEKQAETSYNGQKVVAIKDLSDGSTTYIAATGTPYPAGAKEGGSSKGAVTFDKWNASASISAPKGAVDIGKLGP